MTSSSHIKNLSAAMLAVTCDDVLTVYLDGVKWSLSSDETNKWGEISIIGVTESTKVLAFHCKDGSGGFGLRASVEVKMWNGERVVYTATGVDTGWRCSGVEESGWEQPGFQETSNWKQPNKGYSDGAMNDLNGIAKQAGSIWGERSSRNAFCRKEINIESFVRGMSTF